jgi:uncharacterized delta-60 repeat protein
MKRWLSLVCGVVLTVTRAPEARGALLDLSFDPRTGPDGPVVRMAQQRDGRLLIAGRFQNFAGVPRPGLVRLHEAGQPDLSFDPGTDQHWEVEELALLPDGRILVGWRLDWRLLQLGEPPDAGLVRLYPNGQRDPSFLPPLEFRPNVRIIGRTPGVSSGPRSPAIRFALLPDGGVVLDGRAFRVAGHEPNSLVRLRPDGSWDETFRPGLSLRNWGVRRIAVAPDGTIWVAGDFAGVGLLRFRADGGWEDWQPPAVVPTTVLEIQVLADGRIVGVGTGLELYSRESRVFRLRADGSVDESFPVAALDREASALAVTRDGGVVLAGLFGSVNGIRRPGLAMLDSSGRLLQSFDPTGLPEGDTKFAQAALMVDSLGRVLVAGNFTQIEGQRRAQLARLYAAPQTYEPPRFYWAKDSVVGRESEGRATLVCVRTGSTAGPDYVRYAAVPDTATAGSDFVAVSGLVVFAPGEDTHAVEIPLINDEVEDPWERFKVILTPYDVGTELGEPHEATVRIANDDLSYVVRVLLPATATATVSENQSRLRLSLYITSQAKPAEDPSLLAPEELVEIAYEELGARVGRDYLPIQRPLFQDIDTVDNLDWLGYYARVLPARGGHPRLGRPAAAPPAFSQPQSPDGLHTGELPGHHRGQRQRRPAPPASCGGCPIVSLPRAPAAGGLPEISTPWMPGRAPDWRAWRPTRRWTTRLRRRRARTARCGCCWKPPTAASTWRDFSAGWGNGNAAAWCGTCPTAGWTRTLCRRKPGTCPTD